MGLADAMGKEDRVQIKFSDFYSLVKAKANLDVAMNGVLNGIPHEYISTMLTGKSPLLQQYVDTGMIPEEIGKLEADRKKLLAEVQQITQDCSNKAIELEKANKLVMSLKTELEEKRKKLEEVQAWPHQKESDLDMDKGQ